MHKLKPCLLAVLFATGACLFSGCGQVDENILETAADFSVNINVPYSTTTPLPDYLNVPNQVVIDSNGGVTVNDSSLLNNSYTSAKEDESKYDTLTLGNTGEAVQLLQQRMQELGYYTAGISGVYDDATQAAVKRFEQSYGIMQTGIATPSFQVKLFSADAPVFGSEAYDSAVISQYTTLQRGAVGSSVYALQHRLKELGYPVKELTGVYDANTEQAVRLFGNAYGLDNQTVAYIALQKELYSDTAIAYSDSSQSRQQQASTALGIGNVGTKVMQIQNRLIKLGYLDSEASGVYDADTEAAVRAFEEACGIPSTGRLNGELQSILMSGDAPVFGSTYATTERTFLPLEEGSEGEQVAELQTRLVELGYAAGTANGIYGPETATAMRTFQRYNALEETGRASVLDQTALFSLSALSYQDIKNGLTYATPTPEPTATPDPATIVIPDLDLPDPDNGLYTLKIGSTGDAVTKLQKRLSKLGYGSPVNGTFDEATANALKAFQSRVGVSQTGEANGSMQQYIQTSAAPAKKFRMYNSTQPFETLRQGDTGDAVTSLQRQLWKLGYLLTSDIEGNEGVFHDKTYDAVIKAQRAMGYSNPNGVATPEFQCFVFSDYNYFIKR